MLSQPQAPSVQPNEQSVTREPPPRDAPNRSSHLRNGIYQQAVSQATSSGSSQKRSASARSPSPSHPNKSRRTDLPTGPRAMQREGGTGGNPRSLLDRMGGHAGPNRHQRDEIQARIDNITNNSSDPNMMMANGYSGMPLGGMDINAMAMANPIMLQEIFMNNMALMQQLSSQIGMLQGFAPQGLNIPGDGVPGDMRVFPAGSNNHTNQVNRGRGNGRGGRGSGRGRGGSHAAPPNLPETTAPVSDVTALPDRPSKTPAVIPTIIAPSSSPASFNTTAAPVVAAPTPMQATPPIPYAIPERPQSPSLCKFGLKCTNAHCRWSHPSPVATPESGVVLSKEACENGRNCKDKDCIRAHVSPAILNSKFFSPCRNVAYLLPFISYSIVNIYSRHSTCPFKSYTLSLRSLLQSSGLYVQSSPPNLELAARNTLSFWDGLHSHNLPLQTPGRPCSAHYFSSRTFYKRPYGHCIDT